MIQKAPKVSPDDVIEEAQVAQPTLLAGRHDVGGTSPAHASTIRSPHRASFTVCIVVQRFCSLRSRMPELGTSGSVGAPGE